MKYFISAIGLAIVAALAWHDEGSSLVRRILSTQQSGPGSRALPGAMAEREARSASGVHKCMSGSKVVYTDAPCSRNQEERAMTGGSVTVVEGKRRRVEPPSLSASIPNARALLKGPDEPSLMERTIERATQ